MAPTRTRPYLALLAVLALFAGACGGSDADPATELAEAAEKLAASSFDYTLTLDLDSNAATEVLGPDAAMAAGFVNSLAISGTKGEGAFSLAAAIMGFEPLSLRSYDGGSTLFVRVGLSEIVSSFGGDMASMGLDPAAFADLPGDAGQLMQRLFAGEWVGFTGLDTEGLDDQADAAAELGVDVQQFQELGNDIRDRLADVDGLLADLAVVTRTESEGVKRFEIVVRTEDALREVQQLISPLMNALGEAPDEADVEADIQEMLQGAPPTLPGMSATIEDGDLTEIAFDIGQLLAALDESSPLQPGEIVLRLGFDGHGAASVPDAPAEAVTFDREQLDALSGLLSDPSLLLGEGIGGPTGGAGAADAQAALLLGLQLSVFEDTGAYTSDLSELLTADDSITAVLRDDGRYGVCVTEDGSAFAVGAEIEGQVAYYDSDFRAYTSTDGLPCVPELTGAS